MKDILEMLAEFKANTDCDIKSEWIEDDQKSDFIRQSLALSMAIGILQNIGENNNIPK